MGDVGSVAVADVNNKIIGSRKAWRGSSDAYSGCSSVSMDEVIGGVAEGGVAEGGVAGGGVAEEAGVGTPPLNAENED